jgi:hypothetical protein
MEPHDSPRLPAWFSYAVSAICAIGIVALLVGMPASRSPEAADGDGAAQTDDGLQTLAGSRAARWLAPAQQSALTAALAHADGEPTADSETVSPAAAGEALAARMAKTRIALLAALLLMFGATIGALVLQRTQHAGLGWFAVGLMFFAALIVEVLMLIWWRPALVVVIPLVMVHIFSSAAIRSHRDFILGEDEAQDDDDKEVPAVA